MGTYAVHVESLRVPYTYHVLPRSLFNHFCVYTILMIDICYILIDNNDKG